MSKKKRGEYYTPLIIAEFITKYIFLHKLKEKEIDILEPSVGDGAFIDAVSKHVALIKTHQITFNGIEKNKKAFKKAQKKAQSFQNQKIQFNILYKDFLLYQEELNKKFSICIGNPPYIKKTLLSNKQVEICNEIHKSIGLTASIKNIWTAFLIKCVDLLTEDGIIGLVLPADLLQVTFAESIRSYLISKFERIEIFTFDELMFECKGQDTILLFCFKKFKEQGQFYTHISNLESLSNFQFKPKKNLTLSNTKTKWSHHSLKSDDLAFLYKLASKLKTIDHYCNSSPGLVTAANSYFIISKEIEDAYDLSNYTIPILQKGSFVNGGVQFSKEDFTLLYNNGFPSKLLNLTDKNLNKIPAGLNSYLELGKILKIDKRYKTRNRKNWFEVPGSKKPSEGLFFKRAHFYPKMVKNSASILFTDAAYRIEMKEGYNINSLIYSFYNSLTLAFSELNGRYYGGKVLELTPKEFKSLPIPYIEISPMTFQNFTRNFEIEDEIGDFLSVYDDIILTNLGMKKSDIERVKKIYKQLVDKRFRIG